MKLAFTNKILFHWIEHDIEPTHERLVTKNNSSNRTLLTSNRGHCKILRFIC
ncbi:hypothetical protein RhiirA1_428868, partial [Rhizophagus irregularis]